MNNASRLSRRQIRAHNLIEWVDNDVGIAAEEYLLHGVSSYRYEEDDKYVGLLQALCGIK